MAYRNKGNIRVRLLTLGDTSVGKSNLLLNYVGEAFEAESAPTIGIDFRVRDVSFPTPQDDPNYSHLLRPSKKATRKQVESFVPVSNLNLRVQVFDTAGQERFRSITHNYYRGADGIVLVYDMSRPATFENIKHWMNDINTYAGTMHTAGPNVTQRQRERNAMRPPVVLVGNKFDLFTRASPTDRERFVSIQDGEKLAAFYDVPFFTTSAISGERVTNAFDAMLEQILRRSPEKILEQVPFYKAPLPTSQDGNGVGNLQNMTQRPTKACCSG